MKKIFNYIIFHIYTFQKRVGNEDVASITISLILTVLVWLFINSISSFLFVYYDYEIINLSKVYIILIMIVIFIFIYLYIKKRNYLEYHFEESIKGYFYFIILVVSLFSMFIYFANKSRNKIFEKRGYTKEQIQNGGKKEFNPTEKPKSLEGEIRLWYYNTFEKEKDTINK